VGAHVSYTETTSVSWFGRIKNSVIGVLGGLGLVLVMIILLFWNEGRAVTTARSLAEGAGLVISVDAGRVDPANEGALVHISGQVATNDRPSDPDFGITVNALQLLRAVEMYQWIEKSSSDTETNLGGSETTTTTYTYSMGWSDRYNDSSEFKQPQGRENPTMDINRGYFPVENANIGGFQLSDTVIAMIDNQEPLKLSRDNAPAIQEVVGRSKRVHIVDGNVYLGANPQEPRVGDYRISYRVVPIGPASIVGEQAGNGFVEYQTKAGDRLLLVDDGVVSAEGMFKNAARDNTILTWIIRAVTMFVLVIGFSMLMAPIAVIADVIPFLGSIVRLGTGLVATVLGILVGSITIAIAWFWYRPLLSIVILAVAFGLSSFLTRRARKKAAQTARGAA
jgi:hypothetical protein